MRSAVSPDDLAARARIRDAAIDLIGRHGFAGASLRAIARAAKVSPALIVHHFGDKNGLRAACDAHIVTVFTEQGTEDAETTTIASLQAALSDPGAYGPALAYLARMLSENSESADELFDRMLHGTQLTTRTQEVAGFIRPQRDSDATALILVLLGLAPLVLRRQFTRALGEDDLAAAVSGRFAISMLELLTHGLYSDDSLLRAAAGEQRPDHPQAGSRQ